MRPIVLVLVATALIAASSQPIRADPIRVDQVSALSASADAASSTAHAQPSMVVGISGQLLALEVFLSRWAAGGAPDGRAAAGAASAADVSSLLASHTITPFALPPGLAHAPVQFDLASAQLQVLAGRLVALIQGNPAAGGVDLSGPAIHAGGPSSLPTAASGGGGGLGQAMFAQPDPTPEPTTIALVGSGLLLGAMGRRRLRQRKESNEQ
jgi:hypothetical protein